MSTTPPISYLTAPEQQHLLLLALPIKAVPGSAKVAPTLTTMFSGRHEDGTKMFSDPRPATGVHFFMIYVQIAGIPPAQPPPFPLFQLPPPNGKLPRHLAVVMAIYDADFGPYIGAFTNDPSFALSLDNNVLRNLDETGFVDPDDPTSAQSILASNGTYANPDAFVQLLMRYNWGDPTIPAALAATRKVAPDTRRTPKYFFGGTFPGLTVTKILKATGGYPHANQLWPLPSGEIEYAPSIPPG